jgi:hypothetical protein
MLFDAITSKIVPPRRRVINTTAAGIICIDALAFLFFVIPIAIK